jgi:hypothetical protein
MMALAPDVRLSESSDQQAHLGTWLQRHEKLTLSTRKALAMALRRPIESFLIRQLSSSSQLARSLHRPRTGLAH